MQAKLFYSRFSASLISQAICPHAEICLTKTVDGSVSPPVIQIPTLCVADDGATVEQLWENLKAYNCDPSANKCSACSRLAIPNPVLSNRQAWANLPDVFFLAIGRAQVSPPIFRSLVAAVQRLGLCDVKVSVLQSAHLRTSMVMQLLLLCTNAGGFL